MSSLSWPRPRLAVPSVTLRPRLWIANALMAAGCLLLLMVGGLYAYGLYERYQFDQIEQRPLAAADVAEVPDLADEPFTVEPPPLRLQSSDRADRTAVDVPEDRWQVVPLRREPPLTFAPPTRIAIPSIEVDSKVVQARVVNGTWAVPKFVVGHLTGTALPGQLGNIGFSGHVESISSGNVFARLGEIELGDEIVVTAGGRPRRYEVSEIKVVRNDDLSVVAPTPDERVTLITCTGTWNFVTRDYSHRRIVIGKLAEGPSPPWVMPDTEASSSN